MKRGRVGLVAALVVVTLAAALPVDAQLPAKVPRIAFLWGGRQGTQAAPEEGLRQGLRELGYVEGQNIVIEYRYAENRGHRVSSAARGGRALVS